MAATRTTHSADTEAARERLALRCSAAQKEQIQRAAQIRGLSVSEFVLHVVADAAWQTIRDHELMALSERDSEAFFGAILKPPVPGPRLQQAAERYAARLRSR